MGNIFKVLFSIFTEDWSNFLSYITFAKFWMCQKLMKKWFKNTCLCQSWMHLIIDQAILGSEVQSLQVIWQLVVSPHFIPTKMSCHKWCKSKTNLFLSCLSTNNNPWTAAWFLSPIFPSVHTNSFRILLKQKCYFETETQKKKEQLRIFFIFQNDNQFLNGFSISFS